MIRIYGRKFKGKHKFHAGQIFHYFPNNKLFLVNCLLPSIYHHVIKA